MPLKPFSSNVLPLERVLSTGSLSAVECPGVVAFAWCPFTVLSRAPRLLRRSELLASVASTGIGAPTELSAPVAGDSQETFIGRDTCKSFHALARAEELELAVFALTIPAHGGHLVFAVGGVDAEARRDGWLESIIATLRSFRRSLFPPFALQVQPLPAVPSTCGRLLAGYLLLQSPTPTTSFVPFCELQAPVEGVAHIYMYSDEQCFHKSGDLPITKATPLLSQLGVDSSCFSVGGHLFCARSSEEREVWMQALGCLKLQVEDSGLVLPALDSFRQAVLDCIVKLEVLEAGGRLQERSGRSAFIARDLSGSVIADLAASRTNELETAWLAPPLNQQVLQQRRQRESHVRENCSDTPRKLCRASDPQELTRTLEDDHSEGRAMSFTNRTPEGHMRMPCTPSQRIRL